MQEFLVTFVVAASPVVELRGALPLAIGVYGLPLWQAFFVAVLGNMVPVFLLPFFGGIAKVLSQRSILFASYFNWLFAQSKRRHAKSFEVFRDLALVILVAVPLPFTGAWTATLAAFVFGIPFSRAFPLILLGVIIAGIIVSMITLGIVNI